MSVLLSRQLFPKVSQKELAEQLETRKKCEEKLPSWFGKTKIYYPSKLNIEQTSSELTAEYKSKLVYGKSLIDLTGGFGVDSYFFSKQMQTVFHCEINQELSEIASHNFTVLAKKNINCLHEDGIAFLKKTSQNFDWIYIDPSRRDSKKGKVFLLEDCEPSLPENLSLIFKKTGNVLIKTSPLLDISQGIRELNFVKEVHVLALNNEVKELLFVLEKGFQGAIKVQAVNLGKGQNPNFEFYPEEEKMAESKLDKPLSYLFEPNAAILKSGGFKSVAQSYGLKKLHQHTHLYTSENLLDFPGRRFQVIETLPYSKNSMRILRLDKANITTRNFPVSVAELRKKHKIKDGGDTYLFFTTNMDDKRIILVSKKV